MRRVLFASAGLLALGSLGCAAAWNARAVEALIISHYVRASARENLAGQLHKPPGYPGRRAVDLSPFATELDRVAEARTRELDAFLAAATLPDIQARLAAGELTSSELTIHLLARIRRYDGRLQSVTEIDPDALAAARDLDAERAAGRVRGPLHGIPILLKDNIATAGALHTTAGAAALRDLLAGRDAPLVANLRDGGAVILGKSAMSEWANFTSSRLPNGFSAVGGQVRNPYGAFDVSGSSSGSAVAVAAGLVPVAVGTATWGSLVSPANQNGVVTIKPSIGLVSNEGVIPIIPSQDTAGPMARSVTDAALLLDALAGGNATLHAEALADANLAGLRLGVVGLRTEVAEGDEALLSRAIQALRQAGAEVLPVSPRSLVDVRVQIDDFAQLAEHDFARGVDAFLAGVPAPVRSLADVVAFNRQAPEERVPFGQDRLVASLHSAVSDADARATRARSRSRARAAIDGWLAEADADLLIAIGAAFHVPFCDAGYPALHVPAGRRPSGEPAGLTFVGGLGQEALLIRAGLAYERATRAREAPTLLP